MALPPEATPKAAAEAVSEPAWVTIALIQTTHGLRGELKAEMLTDFPERFRPGLRLQLAHDGKQRQATLEEAWFHKGCVILKLQGLDTISEAATLRGWLVQVPRSERRPLPENRYYVSDLIGYTVVEQGESLGRVSSWEETGAVPLLKVEGGGAELLIPFTAEICYTVDEQKKEIHVRTPEGLRDLNPPPRVSRSSSVRGRPRGTS